MVDTPEIMRFRSKDILDRNCSELIGLCKGVISDKKVCQEEADFLCNWLAANPDAANVYPGTIIANRLAVMMEDGVLDADEAEELKFLLQDMTGEKGQHGLGGLTTLLGFDDPMPEMDFEDAQFCLTGTFEYGSRNEVINLLSHFDVSVSENILQSYRTYLVVGQVVTRAWKFSTHGRKLEKAVLMRDNGYLVSIVSEDHMFNELERLGFIARENQVLHSISKEQFELGPPPWEKNVHLFLGEFLNAKVPDWVTYTKRSSYDVMHMKGKPRTWFLRIRQYASYDKRTFLIEIYGSPSKFTMYASEPLNEEMRSLLLHRIEEISQTFSAS